MTNLPLHYPPLTLHVPLIVSLPSGWCPQGGATAIMGASFLGSLDIVNALLAAGADVNAAFYVRVMMILYLHVFNVWTDSVCRDLPLNALSKFCVNVEFSYTLCSSLTLRILTTGLLLHHRLSIGAVMTNIPSTTRHSLFMLLSSYLFPLDGALRMETRPSSRPVRLDISKSSRRWWPLGQTFSTR